MFPHRPTLFVLVVASLGAAGWVSSGELPGQDPSAEHDSQEVRIRAALKDGAANFWIYDDLEAGYATARETARPLLVSFRCVP